MATNTPQVIEGTWEEVQSRAAELKGRHVRVIVSDDSARPAGDEDPTVALLERWLQEDATDDPLEVQRAEAELAEFKRNMNMPRLEAGERLLYPDRG